MTEAEQMSIPERSAILQALEEIKKARDSATTPTPVDKIAPEMLGIVLPHDRQ